MTDTEGEHDAFHRIRFSSLKGNEMISASRLSECVFVVSTKRPKQVTQKVKDSVKTGVCVCCGVETLGRRGLGTTCYTRWERTRATLIEQEAVAFDAELIRSVDLLGLQEIRKLKASCLFERLANEIRKIG